MAKAKYVVCFTTAASFRQGEKLARILVKERLAACVTVLPGPISFYHWEGKFRKGKEEVLIMKTTFRRLPALEKRLHEIHPYIVPEFVVLPIIKGSKDYLKWMEESVKESGSSRSKSPK